MHKKESPITDKIGKTLLITLYTKSLETKKKDPIIVDESACELVKQIDYDFSKFDKAVRSSVGVAIRSKHFDNMAKAFIEKNKEPIVVIIGCGLDARRKRIGENIAKKAVFYELDIPEVIELRERLLPPPPKDIYMKGSILETHWMDKIREKHPNGSFIFIIEGVIMYFDKEKIKKFFSELANRFPNSDIHFDVINVWMSKKSDKHDSIKYMDAKFRMGIDDDKEIEGWAQNLKHKKTYLYTNFKAYKKIGFLIHFLTLITPRIKYAGRLMHYRVEK